MIYYVSAGFMYVSRLYRSAVFGARHEIMDLGLSIWNPSSFRICLPQQLTLAGPDHLG